MIIDSAELGLGLRRDWRSAPRRGSTTWPSCASGAGAKMAARMFDDAELRPALANIRALELRHAHRPDHGGASVEAGYMGGMARCAPGHRTEGSRLFNQRRGEITVKIHAEERSTVTPGCLVAVTIESDLGGKPFVGRVLRDEDGQHLAWTVDAACTHPPARRFAIPRRNDAELLDARDSQRQA
ncbi:MAG: hypothetical protein U0263_38490 [Polyangiaceae bacterium]